MSSDCKHFSKEVLAIFNRGPLLSPALLSLLEPGRIKFVDEEFLDEVPALLPKVWSRDLDRLYHALTEEEWMVLMRAEREVGEKLTDARCDRFAWNKNKKTRLSICADLDKMTEGFTALRRARFRFVSHVLKKDKFNFEEEFGVFKDFEGVELHLAKEELDRIQDVITAHATESRVALNSAKPPLPKIQLPSAESGKSEIPTSTMLRKEPVSTLAEMPIVNNPIGSSSAFTSCTIDKLALTGSHLCHFRGKGGDQESVTSGFEDCEGWIKL